MNCEACEAKRASDLVPPDSRALCDSCARAIYEAYERVLSELAAARREKDDLDEARMSEISGLQARLAAANERAEKADADLLHYARCGVHAPECKRCFAIWNGREALRSTPAVQDTNNQITQKRPWGWPAQEPKPLPLGHGYVQGWSGCEKVLYQPLRVCGQPESAHQPSEEGR